MNVATDNWIIDAKVLLPPLYAVADRATATLVN